ncbi:MAG TPA: acyl-CoA desaturase [Ktedonobacteraceae bacterium]
MSLSSLDQTAAQPDYGAAYAELRRTVIAAGLLERRYGYYLVRTSFCFLLFIFGVALPFLLPATFGWSTIESIVLGFAMVQVALIGHDAGHLEIFRKTTKNWLLGQLCWSISTGISFWYWNDRHNRHHGHTNDLDEDPDIRGGGPLAIAFTEEEAAVRHGWRRALVKYQIVLVLLGLLLYTFAFRAEGWLFTIRKLKSTRRLLEITLLTLNIALWLTFILVLGWRGFGIFFASNVVGSAYFVATIAPNHNGMPVWARDVKLSFLERQVLSSRDLTSHPVWDFLYGGLNYQIEHHLFPTIPRVNLKRTQAIIQPFCEARGLSYAVTDPLTAYWQVYSELRRVGNAAIEI